MPFGNFSLICLHYKSHRPYRSTNHAHVGNRRKLVLAQCFGGGTGEDYSLGVIQKDMPPLLYTAQRGKRKANVWVLAGPIFFLASWMARR